MPVPTHDLSCRSKAWQTQCHDCSKVVFFFMCSCGSKVFFDSLRPPWPQHQENCLGNKVRLLRDADGLSVDEVELLVEAEAKRRSTVVPATLKKLLRTLGYRETRVPTLLSITPGTETREFVGTLKDANRKVNFFKRFSIPDNAIGHGLLGNLAKGEYVELFLRGPVDPRTGYCAAIEAFVSKTFFDRAGVTRQAQISARLVPRAIGSKARFWIVERLRRVDR